MHNPMVFVTMSVTKHFMIETIEETRLENGLTILTDRMPDVRRRSGSFSASVRGMSQPS